MRPLCNDLRVLHLVPYCCADSRRDRNSSPMGLLGLDCVPMFEISWRFDGISPSGFEGFEGGATLP